MTTGETVHAGDGGGAQQTFARGSVEGYRPTLPAATWATTASQTATPRH